MRDERVNRRVSAWMGTGLGVALLVFACIATWRGKLEGASFAWIVGFSLAFVALVHARDLPLSVKFRGVEARIDRAKREVEGGVEVVRHVAIVLLRVMGGRPAFIASDALRALRDLLERHADIVKMCRMLGLSQRELETELRPLDTTIFTEFWETVEHRTNNALVRRLNEDGIPESDRKKQSLMNGFKTEHKTAMQETLADTAGVRAWLRSQRIYEASELPPTLDLFDELQRIRRNVFGAESSAS